MSDVVGLGTVSTLLEIGASIVIIGGAAYGAFRWAKSRERQIVCDSCRTLFTPKYFKGKQIRKGKHLEYANCPDCGERNEFIVDDE